MKRMAFVIPAMDAGGMQRVMTQLIHYISNKKDIEMHLIIYGKSREIFYEIPQNVIIHKPSFIFSDRYRQWFSLKTMLYLRSEIKKIMPFTILSFGELWNSFVLLALWGLIYPIYISDRCRPDKSFGYFHDFMRKHLYTRAKGIIAQTKTAKSLYKFQFKHENVKVIGNPIRLVEFNTLIERENIIVSVGRLINTKNFERLIQIFYQINNPNWKLIIIGGDAIKQTNSIRLQKLIGELNLKDRIELAGTQKNIESYLLRSKIFAFTSSSEGFPNVIGEAMSAGLPVVSYDCVAGPSDMIEDGKNGYLVPVFDDEMFREKLNQLMNDEILREKMSINARENIKRFSLESIGEQFFEFITK